MASAPFLFPELHAARFGDNRRQRRLILPAKLAAAGADMRLRDERQDAAFEIIKRWAALEESGKLAQMNESQVEGEFVSEVFGAGLGYRQFSQNAESWELQPKFGVNGGIADAAIGEFSRDQSRPRVLIELKGPRVNLDRAADRARSPVQQLWDYLNARPECPWGIVCNCVSFRLYHREHGSRAYELFILHDLAQRRETFNEFFALLGHGGLIGAHAGAEARADKLLRETGERQREVGDELYARYSQERLDLIIHLHTKRKKTLDEAIRIAQRLIDRIIFIAFCEDRGLINSSTLRRTFEQVPLYHRATNPRWRNFLELFRAVDAGHQHLGIPHGYNGNLFKPDPEIDELDLDDEWTHFFKDVGDYDFRDEVNVDVLGNLFERSITELERLRESGLFGLVDSEPPAGRMEKSAQRKRLGVYYTPPDFTRLIVLRTVGDLVTERFSAAAAAAGLDQIPVPSADLNRRKIVAYVDAALEVLSELRVVDPACGSGAFLIAAYEELNERYLDLADLLDAVGDPARGAKLRTEIPDRILRDNLFGVDLSAEAVEITQLALWIRSARIGRTLADLSQNIRHGNSLVEDRAVDPAALSWNSAFPAAFDREHGGFDCVIGNPPWERLKLQEREFFSLSAPEIASAVNAATRRKMIAALETSNPQLYAHYQAARQRTDALMAHVRSSGRYPLTGRNDLNTYMLFAELSHSLVAPHGLAGLLVPSGIATDDTTKLFFSALMESQTLRCFYDFENKRGHFREVHRSFKFCCLVFGGSARSIAAADFVFFARDVEQLADSRNHIPLSNDDLKLLNPNTRTCPIFRTRRDAALTKQIYGNAPVLIDRARKSGGNPWGVRFLRMFDQTNDAELFITAEELVQQGCKRFGSEWRKGKHRWLPLYEAKMVQAYDHRAASVLVTESNWMRQGQTAATSLVQHQNPEFAVEPRWWVEWTRVLEAIGTAAPPAMLAFKDVTSPTNQRTMIASFIPLAAVANSAPLVFCEGVADWKTLACFLGNLNSFALDFVARQKVGGVHLNFYIVEQLPVLPPERYAAKCPWQPRTTLERWISDRVLKLTCTADDMRPFAEVCGFKSGVHRWDPAERATLRAELDAAYFHLYRIGRADVEYILSTFQGLRESETPSLGEPGAEQVLRAYDALVS